MLSRFGVHHWWWAPYHGDTLPYQPDTRWLDGDREGYSCAYGFLERGDEIVGRFTATRIEGAAYAKVNDRDMGEAERYYDGTPFGGDTGEIPDESCVNEAAALSSIDYTDPEVCARPDERPRIVFWDDGDVLEIRDYRNTVLHSDEGKFVWLGVEDNRATVAFCVEEGPAIAFYYDGLGDGIVTGDLP